MRGGRRGGFAGSGFRGAHGTGLKMAVPQLQGYLKGEPSAGHWPPSSAPQPQPSLPEYSVPFSEHVLSVPDVCPLGAVGN